MEKKKLKKMSSHHTPIYIVDAFTSSIFKGNPAAVVLLSGTFDDYSDNMLQSCATEMQLSETVFVTIAPHLVEVSSSAVQTREAGNGGTATFHIRWFTPAREVGLCGHATLAAAHALYSSFLCEPLLGQRTDACEGNTTLNLFFRHVTELATNVSSQQQRCRRFEFCNAFSGRVSVELPNSTTALYTLDFPLRTPRTLINGTAPPDVLEKTLQDVCAAMGLPHEGVEDFQLHDGSGKYLLVVKDPASVRAMVPDIQKLVSVFAHSDAIKEIGVPPLSLTVTSSTSRLVLSTSGVDSAAASSDAEEPQVVSRHFAPWVGIDEDPVTGAAHVVLVPYWVRRTLLMETTVSSISQSSTQNENDSAKTKRELECSISDDDMQGRTLLCYQASARGGYMRCTVRPGSRIALEGAAVTFLRGVAAF